MRATSSAVAVEGLSVSYGTHLALDDVTLDLKAGEITGLIGGNGAGKSTLFKSIMGQLHPTAGAVRYPGIGSGTIGAALKANALSYVPQSEKVDWSFPITVREVVMHGRYGFMGPLRIPKSRDREAVDAALERTRLTELAGRQIGQLSGGQRKRAFVARGIAQDASLMLLDEPFAGVDKVSEQTIVQLLNELSADGRMVFLATHDLESVPRLCDRVVMLNRRIVADGPPSEVIGRDNLIRAFGADPKRS